ncbi:MAG: hypothetical protein AAF547_14370 [Actinomycetota bacterium]
MAASTGRLMAIAVAVSLTIAACTDADDDIGAELDAAAEAAETSTTVTTAAPSTTTSEATTTTLSERAQAEAEIRQVVTEWYEFPVDTSQGEEALGVEQTTGLLRQRLLESLVLLEADGQILRISSIPPIEITSIAIDLENGTAEVDACTGPAAELVDAETLEVIAADDPTDTAESMFQLQLVDGTWLISDWIASGRADGNRIKCEIGA